MANDTQDEASKKQKITSMTTHGDENEVLRQIISKERLAKTTASVLRGNKVNRKALVTFLLFHFFEQMGKFIAHVLIFFMCLLVVCKYSKDRHRYFVEEQAEGRQGSSKEATG